MENTLEKINKAGLTLLETLTPEETYTAVVSEAMRLVDAEYASILLDKEDVLTRVYASAPFLSKINFRKDSSIETAFKHNKLIISNIDDKTKVNPIIRRMGILSIILIPLAYRGKTIGVLSVHSKKKEHFSGKEVDMLRIFGSMASFAINKSHMYSETRKALEIRDMFISMAAHELRTPLTSISGYIQLLYSRLAKQDDSVGKWIRSLYEENKRMMHLVKELLEVNRMRAGQLQFRWQECNLDIILTECVKEMSQRYSGRQINYISTIKEEPTVIGDSIRLIQVFNNIIDNALKYSPHDAPVEITLTGKQNLFIISIKDLGKGIDKKDLPNIFEGRHKGGGGEEGFGIGLFFVENVVRQHRGSINVISKLKKGTTIQIQLPIARYGI